MALILFCDFSDNYATTLSDVIPLTIKYKNLTIVYFHFLTPGRGIFPWDSYLRASPEWYFVLGFSESKFIHFSPSPAPSFYFIIISWWYFWGRVNIFCYLLFSLKYKSKYIFVIYRVNKLDILFNTGWLNVGTLKLPL